MKQIIVTTDFSPAAYNAARYAADMALVVQANLLLLNVVQTPVGYSDLPIVISLENMMRSSEKDMDDLKTELLKITNGQIKIEAEVGMGSFYGELKNVCEGINPDVVVMGSQGKTAAEHLMFGSHAVHAVKYLNWPVLTVPPGFSFTGLKKIALASNLTAVVETTPIKEIALFVNTFDAEFHILNTAKKEAFDENMVFESGLMQEITKALKPQFHFIGAENTDQGIIDFVTAHHIDLLIVLPRRYNFFENLVHRSHTKQLVLHCHAPVMSIH